MAIFHALGEIYVLSDRKPLNTYSFTVWARRLKYATTAVTFGTLFPYAIVTNNGSLSATFEAHSWFLRHVSSSALASEADYSFVERYFRITAVDSIYETDVEVSFVICSPGIIS